MVLAFSHKHAVRCLRNWLAKPWTDYSLPTVGYAKSDRGMARERNHPVHARIGSELDCLPRRQDLHIQSETQRHFLQWRFVQCISGMARDVRILLYIR